MQSLSLKLVKWKENGRIKMGAKLNKAITAVLSACLVAAVGLTVYIAITPHVGERFTEFYILGPSGKAARAEDAL
ncbi:MAG: DUF1616 domain-containing protein [Thermoproteota archaeon]